MGPTGNCPSPACVQYRRLRDANSASNSLGWEQPSHSEMSQRVSSQADSTAKKGSVHFLDEVHLIIQDKRVHKSRQDIILYMQICEGCIHNLTHSVLGSRCKSRCSGFKHSACYLEAIIS